MNSKQEKDDVVYMQTSKKIPILFMNTALPNETYRPNETYNPFEQIDTSDVHDERLRRLLYHFSCWYVYMNEDEKRQVVYLLLWIKRDNPIVEFISDDNNQRNTILSILDKYHAEQDDAMGQAVLDDIKYTLSNSK